MRHSPVFGDYKQDAFLAEFLTDGHITLKASIKICIGTQPREYMPAGRRRFVEDIATILDTGLDSDFSLICDDREFPCHRAILRARSDVFANEHWGKFVRSYPDMVTEVFRAVIESQK